MPGLWEAVWQHLGRTWFSHQNRLTRRNGPTGKAAGCPSRSPRTRPAMGQSVSMVASGSSKIGIPLRRGYTRLHSLHFRASSPRITSGLRHTGQASISSRSGLIMAVILAGHGVLLLVETYRGCVKKPS